MTESSSYQKQQCPPILEEMEEEIVPLASNTTMGEPSHPSRRFKPLLLLAAVAACVVAAIMVAYHASSSSMKSSSVQNAALWGSSSSSAAAGAAVTPCTFAECTSSMCNAQAAPYMCLWHNGGVHGGCSPTPWTDETCTTQCDVSDCDSLEIPDSVPDCSGGCSTEWCEMGRLCGGSAPYQCTVGASAFGCSADPYQWTFRVTEAACSSCCKTSSCA